MRYPIVAALLLSPSVTIAQRLPPASLDSGTLVRIHLSSTHSVRGRLLTKFNASSAAFTFCPYPAPPCTGNADSRIATIPLDQVIGYDRAIGTHWDRGLVIGGLAGAALGGLFVAAYSELCDTSSCRAGAWRGFVIPFTLGLGLGAAFGSASIKWGLAQ